MMAWYGYLFQSLAWAATTAPPFHLSAGFLMQHYDTNGDEHLSTDEVSKIFLDAENKKARKMLKKFADEEDTRRAFFNGLKKRGLVPSKKNAFSREDLYLQDSTKTPDIADQWELKNLEYTMYDLNRDGVLSDHEFYDFHEVQSRAKDVHEMIAADVQRYTKYFKELDANSDQQITQQEATTGKRHPHLLFNREVLFGLCDANKDSFLGLKEFACFSHPPPKIKAKYQAKSIMEIERWQDGKHVDSADGKLSLDEIKSVLSFGRAKHLLNEQLQQLHTELR